MFGLLLKDFYQMKKQLRVLLFLAVLYAIISVVTENSAFFAGLSAMLCIMMPLTSFSFDQYAKWDNYALTMPLSRKQIVTAKYLLGYGVLAVSLPLSAAIQYVTVRCTGIDTFEGHFPGFLVGISAASVMLISITLPVIIKFGVEKSRFVLITIFVIPTVLGLIAAQLDIPFPVDTLMSLAKLLPLAAIVFALGSYFLSVRFYEQKEF